MRFKRAAVGQTHRSPPPPPPPQQQYSRVSLASKSRHQLMRLKFYTNNERSQGAGLVSGAGQPAGRQEQENLLHPGRHIQSTEWTGTAGVPATGYQLDLLGEGGRPTSQGHDFKTPSPPIAVTANSTAIITTRPPPTTDGSLASLAAATTQLPKECLQQYNPAYHSASPSMPSGVIGDPRALLDFAGAQATPSSGDLEPSAGVGNLTSSTPPLVDCSDQFALMNIRTEELNFADTEQVWLVKSWPEILARVSCVAPIVLLGLIGNLTIIYSMCRFKPIRSKPTNIFILNMALADLLTTIVCPNAALLTDIYQFYAMGALVCRTEGFIKVTCLLVSAYSLIVLSFDWFLSVVRPCRTRVTIKQSWLTLAGIWLISVSMASPLLYWRRLRERQWRDISEVWCCELIQYTKYYWVCITLFLIYLPTFVMTIVLVVILAQMDRFEAKLRRSRGLHKSTLPSAGASGGGSGSRSGLATPTVSLAGPSSGFATTTSQSNNNNNLNLSSTNLTRISASATAATPSHLSKTSHPSTRSERQLSNSLSLGMKYRRRIVKILFFYLLTSIVCWTPLQFTIIYRHFRSEAVPAGWFFELTFYSQLSASLSAAMNPIIFGFLSQPFRRVVTKSWMFRFLDKIWRSRSDPGGGGGELHVMNHRQGVAVAMSHRNGVQQGHEREPPKLTFDYIEHNLNNNNNNSNNNQTHHDHHLHSHHNNHRQPNSSRQAQDAEKARTSTGKQSSQRPRSTNMTASSTRALGNHLATGRSSAHLTETTTQQVEYRLKRVSFKCKNHSNSNGGLENAAYLRNEDDEENEDGKVSRSVNTTDDMTTSFIVTATSALPVGRAEQETKKQDCDPQ